MTSFWPDGTPLRVRMAGEAPLGFEWRGGRHSVMRVSSRWRVHTAWWQEEAWRDYWEVTTDTGFLCVIFCDLREDRWFLERVYA